MSVPLAIVITAACCFNGNEPVDRQDGWISVHGNPVLLACRLI